MAGAVAGTIYSETTGQPYFPKEGDMTRLFVEIPAVGYRTSWVTFSDTYDSSACPVNGTYDVKVPPGTGTIKARADVKQPDGMWESYWSPVYPITVYEGQMTVQDIYVPVPAVPPPRPLPWLAVPLALGLGLIGAMWTLKEKG